MKLPRNFPSIRSSVKVTCCKVNGSKVNGSKVKGT